MEFLSESLQFLQPSEERKGLNSSKEGMSLPQILDFPGKVEEERTVVLRSGRK